MEKLAHQAVSVIEGYKQNKIIMDFVTKEAREKVAEEIRKEIHGGTTAKAVQMLEMRYDNIKQRVEQYIQIGLIGCYMASLEK